jgi:hypothetical protein
MSQQLATAHTDPWGFDHRKAARISRKQGFRCASLAQRTGKGSKSVEDYLAGRTSPSSAWVGILADLLGVHPGDLYCRISDLTSPVVDVRQVTQVRVLSRRRRLQRRTP